MKPYLLPALILIGFGLVIWLMGGIYEDREFIEPWFFLKHRPTPKFFFRAPIGESDKKFETLSPEDQYEEKSYVEFVETHGGFKRHIPWPF